jgi:hypothetical protein
MEAACSRRPSTSHLPQAGLEVTRFQSAMYEGRPSEKRWAGRVAVLGSAPMATPAEMSPFGLLMLLDEAENNWSGQRDDLLRLDNSTWSSALTAMRWRVSTDCAGRFCRTGRGGWKQGHVPWSRRGSHVYS